MNPTGNLRRGHTSVLSSLETRINESILYYINTNEGISHTGSRGNRNARTLTRRRHHVHIHPEPNGLINPGIGIYHRKLRGKRRSTIQTAHRTGTLLNRRHRITDAGTLRISSRHPARVLTINVRGHEHTNIIREKKTDNGGPSIIDAGLIIARDRGTITRNAVNQESYDIIMSKALILGMYQNYLHLLIDNDVRAKNIVNTGKRVVLILSLVSLELDLVLNILIQPAHKSKKRLILRLTGISIRHNPALPVNITKIVSGIIPETGTLTKLLNVVIVIGTRPLKRQLLLLAPLTGRPKWTAATITLLINLIKKQNTRSLGIVKLQNELLARSEHHDYLISTGQQ